MNTKLISYFDSFYLLKKNGDLLHASLRMARDFMLNYTASEYNENAEEVVCPVREDDIKNKIIAEIDVDGNLLIKDPVLFKKIMEDGDSDYLSVTQYAEKEGKSVSMVRRCCQNNQIPGVRQFGNSYFIPSDAPYPGSK